VTFSWALLLLAALSVEAQTKLKTDILWRAGGSVGIDRISPDGNEFTSPNNGSVSVWTRSGRQRLTLTESGGSPVSFSPNGQDLVGVVGLSSVSSASAIGIWSRATGELNRIISLQGFGANELVLSPDGAYLAALVSSSSQTRVRLIEYATGLLVTNVDAVYGLKPVFSPDG